MKTSCAAIALGCSFFLCAFAEAGTSQLPSNAVPRIEITPNPAFIDQPIKILLRDFPARRPLAVQLAFTDRLGYWQSHADFLTDRHGNADLATQAPISGTYRHADPGGLFWSLKLVGSNSPTQGFTNTGSSSSSGWHLTLSASVNGGTAVTATIDRLFLSPGVRQIQVREHGLRGTLFLPAGKGPWPAVIVVGGSGGGLPGNQAEFLAAKGYAAFALAYFNYQDLPTSLENIPLEYFQTAIHWLQARDDIRPNSIAVLGTSRGGELALLLGATFPEIHAVVAISGSSVLWGGLGTNADSYLQPAWTWQGKPLLFMDSSHPSREQQEKFQRLEKQNSLAYAPWFQVLLDDKAAAARASIPVEKINGPVMLISGKADELWPSTEMADMVMKRLKQARHPFPDRHLAYPGAGHALSFPNTPTTLTTIVHPVTKDKLAMGGDPEHIAAAATDAWPRIVKFLNRSLSRDRR